ncbi:MAG: hypothetical protein M3Q39_14095 [Actinomycetota bacterium]|nr:hypothetical protein [Actinomycetota bacterium]
MILSLPGGSALSVVVYIDHDLGTLVKDRRHLPPLRRRTWRCPVEDWFPDSSTDSIPFDRDSLNRELAALRGNGP